MCQWSLISKLQLHSWRAAEIVTYRLRWRGRSGRGMLQEIRCQLHSGEMGKLPYNQIHKAATTIHQNYSGYEMQDDENQFWKSISQVNAVLIPSPWNNSTIVAKTLPVLSQDPHKNPADPVFQKSNNEKIKSCGAFPLSALFMNS